MNATESWFSSNQGWKICVAHLTPFDRAQHIVGHSAHRALPFKYTRPSRHATSLRLLHDTCPLSNPQGFEMSGGMPTAEKATLSHCHERWWDLEGVWPVWTQGGSSSSRWPKNTRCFRGWFCVVATDHLEVGATSQLVP